ncbi:hypothetical protein NL676_022631 [Syzygium grande]|nr:hypothetical protein NL676_022631 [Syzygium grande]
MSCLALALNGHKLNGHGRGVAEPAEIWTAHGHRDRRDLIELVFNRPDVQSHVIFVFSFKFHEKLEEASEDSKCPSQRDSCDTTIAKMVEPVNAADPPRLIHCREWLSSDAGRPISEGLSDASRTGTPVCCLLIDIRWL